MSRARSKKPAEGQVTVYLVGTSHNGKNGDQRNVSSERAEELVKHGLARYPDDHPSNQPAE